MLDSGKDNYNKLQTIVKRFEQLEGSNDLGILMYISFGIKLFEIRFLLNVHFSLKISKLYL